MNEFRIVARVVQALLAFTIVVAINVALLGAFAFHPGA
jgi:hypothetical protein